MANKRVNSAERALLNDIVRDYAYYFDQDYRATWNLLYATYRRVYHINLKIRAKNRHIRAIAYAEQAGHLDRLIALANWLFLGYDQKSAENAHYIEENAAISEMKLAA